MTTKAAWAIAAWAGIAASQAARPAAAAECASLPAPTYVTGSTAAKPFLAEIGKLMAGQSPAVTVAYLGVGSCAGVDAIVSGTPIAGSGTGAFSYWDKDGIELKCDVAASAPIVADIGISDVFATTCFALPGGLSPSVADFLGPVQAMAFVVHKASSEATVSAEAAYNIYGFGSDSQVSPWVFEGLMFRRDELSGTQRMIAAAIGVPPQRWKGTATKSSDEIVMKLGTASFPDQSIGILSAEVAQENRATVKVLAYQHFGQSCALYPDSSEGANDKANVRNGAYKIWGPLHLVTRVDGSGLPANAKAGEIIGHLTGTRPAPAGFDLIRIEAQRHVVPQCAMRVRRAQEMGPALPYTPSGPCGCYYEKLANGATACKACTTSAECPASAPVCSFDHCEPP